MSASTICRALKRNTGQKGYPYQQVDAVARRHQASCRPKKMLPALIEVIEEK
jgi:IS30 family transposase